MRAELRPRLLAGMDVGGGWEWVRTWVRELVPRKPEVDRRMGQSVHLFQQGGDDDGSKGEKRRLVVYVPHVERAEEMPFYHPIVKALGFLYDWTPDEPERTENDKDETLKGDREVTGQLHSEGRGMLSIHVVPFPETELQSTRLDRTVRNLLQTLHKHGHGRMQGYEKRVHHDQIIGQKRFQDEYTRLKSKYAKGLCEGWAEVTDPRKHVFEDLGIAAFLICLWETMYGIGSQRRDGQEDMNGGREGVNEHHLNEERSERRKSRFPGFVDLGCGNGVLVNILVQEGWEGWGFDVRRRKSWEVFPEEVGERLKEMILVPGILQRAQKSVQTKDKEISGRITQLAFHDGVFPQGTFIISNHADELTGWTPLLARLSRSPFIAIPCCSHDLAGTRFRAPSSGLRSQSKETIDGSASKEQCEQPKSGSLKKSKSAVRQPSAYASLCSYVTCLTELMGYVPEKEMLRIPSTRNAAIIGRKNHGFTENDANEEIAELVATELKLPLEQVAGNWTSRVNKLIQSKGNH